MKIMKVIIIILLLLILIVGAYVLYNKLAPTVENNQLAPQSQSAEGDNADAAEQKTAAPDFTLHDVDGNTYKLSDFRGKPVILNFWASWCGPCKIEMPDFQKKFEEYGEDIHFLIVNMTDGKRETVEKASGFIAEQGFTFPVYYDIEQEAAYTYGVTAMPTTYFLDAEGYFVAQARGALDADTLQSGIDMLLDAE